MAASASTSRTLHNGFHLRGLQLSLCLLLIFSCLASGALTRGTETRHLHIRRAAPPVAIATTMTRPAYQDATFEEEQLRKRAVKATEEESTTTESSSHAKTTTKTKSSTKETTETATDSETTDEAEASETTLTISVTQATSTTDVTASPLPEAFDGNLDAELDDSDSSSNCPTFLNGILDHPSYAACYPLSMMLQTSQGFFNAQKQLLSIVRVLDATCAANVTYCTEFFDEAASNLTTSANCKKEWDEGNTVVKEFLYGLQAYEMMYQATCLQDPDSDMYCYANAVTNTTTASNAYFYYLPYNLTLPGSTVPACSWCIQETMAIFHTASADRSQPISNTYEAAARQVNTICGIDFVNSTLPKAESSSISSAISPPWMAAITSLLTAALFHTLL